MKLNKVMAVMASALRWCYLDVVQWEPPLKRNRGKNPDERNNLAGTFK
jgi:hypothetical protein